MAVFVQIPGTEEDFNVRSWFHESTLMSSVVPGELLVLTAASVGFTPVILQLEAQFLYH